METIQWKHWQRGKCGTHSAAGLSNTSPPTFSTSHTPPVALGATNQWITPAGSSTRTRGELCNQEIRAGSLGERLRFPHLPPDQRLIPTTVWIYRSFEPKRFLTPVARRGTEHFILGFVQYCCYIPYFQLAREDR